MLLEFLEKNYVVSVIFDRIFMCNSIAIQNFKCNFDFSATKRCLTLTSLLWTLKIGKGFL